MGKPVNNGKYIIDIAAARVPYLIPLVSAVEHREGGELVVNLK